MNNVSALGGVSMESNMELIMLLDQSMNQVPVQEKVPFNIIEPEKIFPPDYTNLHFQSYK